MGKTDDLTNVPANVLKQQKDAEAKIAALNKEPEPAQPLNTEPDPIQPANNEPKPVDLDPEPAPINPVINDGTSDSGQWQHKYNVLQGKYNKEVGDLKDMIVDLKAQMERQNKVIEGLNSQKPAAAPTNVEIADLDPSDFEGWGDEMKGMATRVNELKKLVISQQHKIAQYESGQQPAQSDDGLSTRVESLESEIHDGRIASYLKFLDDNVKGDWRAINKNAHFNAWVQQVDPISLQPRLTALTSAAENLRGAQVASIFNLYVSEVGENVGVSIADELPNGGGNGGFDPKPRVSVDQEAVKKAQNDFVQGRITEEEFDKIYSQFQATLKRSQK